MITQLTKLSDEELVKEKERELIANAVRENSFESKVIALDKERQDEITYQKTKLTFGE